MYCDINVLKKIDEILNIYAYEINIIDNAFWNYIEHYNFNIDVIDSISFNSKKNVASLQMVDYENYIRRIYCS